MCQRSKIMKNHLRMTAALALSFIGSAFVPELKADDWDKKTRVTIDQSIDVQGTVLPAGSYVMKLLGSPDQRTVEIFNAAENHLLVTVLASPVSRFNPTDRSEFRFYDGAAGQPQALRAWFYPGDDIGFGFRSAQGRVGQSARQHANATAASIGGE
jgi:hypothetical protein